MTKLTSRRGMLFGAAAVSAGAVLAGCTSNDPDGGDDKAAADTQPAADDKPGKPVTIGYAGPQADHGWLNAVNDQAKKRAEKYSEITMEITEGSNDTAQQIGQIETLINKKVDVLVILPADGKALTQVGLKAMRAGIPVINLDRIFNSPQAYRCWVGGDNYGMGLNAAHYIGEKLKDKSDAKVIELAGIDNLELTQQRTQGFDDGLKNYPNIKKVARQAAEFTVWKSSMSRSPRARSRAARASATASVSSRGKGGSPGESRAAPISFPASPRTSLSPSERRSPRKDTRRSSRTGRSTSPAPGPPVTNSFFTSGATRLDANFPPSTAGSMRHPRGRSTRGA
ncbi:substrate-binding domain-containing protein [Streptomyces violaceoruber]